MPAPKTRSNSKPPAASPRLRFAPSPRPAWILFPWAALPSMCARWICRCASSGAPKLTYARVSTHAARSTQHAARSTQHAAESNAVGGLEHTLGLRYAIALGVVDAQALQHVDDFLVFGEFGNGLLAGEMTDFVDRAHHFAV